MIYIEGQKGKTLYIENKIYAKDQKAQLTRYFNHKKTNNVLLYLTLYGVPPSNQSIKKADGTLLKAGTDFHIISYKEDIAFWLKECIKESAEQPILRESIKQYLILIKKLTNTMAQDEQEDLKHLIVKNMEASRFIFQNYAQTIRQIRRDFRDAVIKELIAKLKAELKVDYIYILGGEISTTHAPVWIKQNKDDNIHFGIEPFSGNGNSFSNGKLFIGLCANKNNFRFDSYQSEFGKTDFWHKTQLLYLENNEVLNLENSTLLKQLSNKESASFHKIVKSVVNQSFKFIKENKSIINKK